MGDDKPTNIDEYKKWLKKTHDCDVTAATRNYYETVVTTVRQAFESSDFWGSLTKQLGSFDDEYLIQTGYRLLEKRDPPKIEKKPFDSFLLKTFRKNILENSKWSDPPDEGWILPANWFSRINDIVRTLLVVKYLDGIEFLVEKIQKTAQDNELELKVFFEAREEGYYAVHLYVCPSVEIPEPNWNTTRVDASVEIQITTQLQEVIRRLLHKYYEQKRDKTKSRGYKWQWDYKSNEFVANYLGHILHYVEGMIVDIRQKQIQEK